MCEKLEDSLGCGHGNSLPDDRAFPENYLPASSSEAPQEASVEYLQAVAEVRLCLSRAAELIFDLQQHTGESDCSAGNAACRAGELDTGSALCSARTSFGAWPRRRAATPFFLGGVFFPQSVSVPCTVC